MKMGSAAATMGASKRRLSSRGLGGALREQRAKLYIIRRCVVMLLCWHDYMNMNMALKSKYELCFLYSSSLATHHFLFHLVAMISSKNRIISALSLTESSLKFPSPN
ncbi:hypothetical protein L6164_001785 [Bauhinia variegata]|uniref:Uncharacterized protein n=1 Tax=Bauhinia variegata TaxID=167791 RepID=A0ACB9QAJ7_BAUVA|nr:hypothetical protein L6164_001785 [Bauhinia variegata]